jgi:hypothetical protein
MVRARVPPQSDGRAMARRQSLPPSKRDACSQARARAGAGARTGRCPARCPRNYNAHPHQLLRRCGSSGTRDRGHRLLAAALRPAHWPLGGGSSGSGVLLALLARLPLGLHVALNLSPMTSGGGRFSATRLTLKSKRLRCPGGRSGLAISGRLRMVLRARARVFRLQINLTFGPKVI